MSEKRPGLEDVDALLREAHEKIEEVRVRVALLVKDMSATIERLEEGLKQGDKNMVDSAVDELKMLVKYLDRVVYSHVLSAVVKVSEAGLKLAEIASST
jgi:hypothetical protein